MISIIKIAPIILLTLAVFFGAHYFIYYSAIHFFDINNPLVRTILIWTLVALSLSFFFSAVLVHLKDNIVIRIFYTFSGFWVGLLIYLLATTAISWVIVWLAKLNAPNAGLVAVALTALALFFSIYGVFNAFNPRIKHLEIKIKNLPEQWQEKTIVQLSDIHLGAVHKNSFLQNIANKTNSLNPDLIFITGDLFDGMDGGLDFAVEPLNNFKAKEGIYFITGNHEIYLGVEKVIEILQKTQVKILNDEIIDINGLQVIGLSYPEQENSFPMGKKDIQNIILSQNNFVKDKPTVLLKHAPSQIKEIQALGINLLLCGHTHDGQLFPLDLINDLLWRGNSFGLRQSGDFSIYTTSGLGTWGPPMRTTHAPEIVAIKLK